MKIQLDKIALPGDVNSLMSDEQGSEVLFIEGEHVKEHQVAIQDYIKSSRAHLEAVKSEIYKVIDAGYKDASLYEVQSENPSKDALNDHQKPDYYNEKPSAFLEKAYTLQTYDANGGALDNRNQPYIDAGKAFATKCDDTDKTLSTDDLLLNDAGKMIGAINSALSQLNKIEASFVKAKENEAEYDIAGGNIPVLPRVIQNVMKVAEDSKLVKILPNQNLWNKLISGLSNIVKSISKFISNIGKSEEQKIKSNHSAAKAACDTAKENYQARLTPLSSPTEKKIDSEKLYDKDSSSPYSP